MSTTTKTEEPATVLPELKFYQYMFEADKRPTPQFESLLRSIARYIIEHVGDKRDKKLSPSKLAAFYKAVGGNYDALFAEVPYPSISYIYQSTGCQHTLQPTVNDFAPPSIPALTVRGFVRWESIETLLCPDEHVRYLQNAVTNFVIRDCETGEQFPELPSNVFPPVPDPQIEKWHYLCAERLRDQVTPEELEHPMTRPSLSSRPPTNVRSGTQDAKRSRSPYRGAKERRQGADYFSLRSVIQKVTGRDNEDRGHRGSRHTSLDPEDVNRSRTRRRSVPENNYPSSHGGARPSRSPLTSRSPPSRRSESLYPQKTNDNERRNSPSRRRQPNGSTSSSSLCSSCDDAQPRTSVSGEDKPSRRVKVELSGEPNAAQSAGSRTPFNGTMPPPPPPTATESPYRTRPRGSTLPHIQIERNLPTNDDARNPWHPPASGSRSAGVQWRDTRSPVQARRQSADSSRRRTAADNDGDDDDQRRRRDGNDARLLSPRSGSHNGRWDDARRERNRDVTGNDRGSGDGGADEREERGKYRVEDAARWRGGA